MMDNPINILLIDDEGPVDSLDVARCFSNTPNVTIHVITRRNRKQKLLRHSRYINKIHYFPPGNDHFFLSNIIETIKSIEIPVLFPLTIKTQILILENINAFNGITKIIPLSDMSIIEKVENKWTLNEFLRKNDFPHAKCLLFENYQDVMKNITQINTPLLLKPVTGSGGEGIFKFDSHDDILSHLNSHDIDYNSIILQDYINDYTVDISLLAKKGEILAHSIQTGIAQSTVRFAYNPGIKFITDEELVDLTRQIISTLNYSGVAHLDFCYDIKEKKYILIDFNARFWGTLLGSHSVGINFPYLTCLAALDIPFDPPTYSNDFFLLTRATITETIKNLIRKKKLAFNLKQTKIKYIMKDPLPEIFKIAAKLFRL